MSQPIHSIFVTLRRSFAGTRESHVRIVQSLGLRKRQQTVRVPNTATARGAIDKVTSCCMLCSLPNAPWLPAQEVCTLQIKHLISVETNGERTARLAREAAAKAPREPIRVQHKMTS